MTTTWAPTTDDVKALIPQRTGGRPFDEDTIPTLSDVAALIEQIVAEVEGEAGTIPADDRIEAFARRVVALGTAAQVELAFFPEQTGLGDTTVGQILFGKYQTLLERLRTQLELRLGIGSHFAGSISMAPTARVDWP